MEILLMTVIAGHVLWMEYRLQRMRNVVRAMITLMLEDDEE